MIIVPDVAFGTICVTRENYIDSSWVKVSLRGPDHWRDMQAEPRSIQVNSSLFIPIIEVDLQPARKANDELMQVVMSMGPTICPTWNIINIENTFNRKRNMIVPFQKS